ncbi:MAG: hypothetical protein AAF081_02855 [Actinomycetota bacterium]
MIGLGTQDDFAYAQEFVETGGLTDGENLTFLWDPSFATWQGYGVRANSSMAILSADLSTTSSVFFGFGDAEQQQVLDALANFT